MIIDVEKIPPSIGTTVLKTVCLLVEHGPMNLTQLGDRVDVTSAAMTGVADSGETTGLLERFRNPNGRRTVMLRVTEAGAAMAASLKPEEVAA